MIHPSLPGGDALVSSGIMESLLEVLEWKAFEPMNITVSPAWKYVHVDVMYMYVHIHRGWMYNVSVSKVEDEYSYWHGLCICKGQ